MSNPYKEDLSRFAVSFMRAVIAWNNAESTARRILIAFGGKSFGLIVAAEHLGNRALKEALLTLCDTLSDDDAPEVTELASHIAHFVEGMDTLRAYRNFYVHSLKLTGKSPENPKTFRGFLQSVEARGRYAFVSHHLTTEELEHFMVNTLTLEGYGKAIAAAIPGHRNALHALDGEPSPSLHKPTWPGKLKKHRNYLQERSHPPAPSQA